MIDAMTGSSIAFFISPHGFGHSARSAAIIQSLHQLEPTLDFHIFTLAPRWFFETSLPFAFSYHECLTDIGLVQSSPLEEDLPATLKRLSGFLPFHTRSASEDSARAHPAEMPGGCV